MRNTFETPDTKTSAEILERYDNEMEVYLAQQRQRGLGVTAFEALAVDPEGITSQRIDAGEKLTGPVEDTKIAAGTGDSTTIKDFADSVIV